MSGQRSMRAAFVLGCSAVAYADYVWFPNGEIQSVPIQAGAEFGHSVSISDEFAIFGAPNTDLPTFGFAGAAYVATRTGKELSALGLLLPPMPISSSHFGRAVDVSGSYAVVGAPEELLLGENGTGAVYVFHHDGVSWSFEARLTPDEHSIVTPDGFGSSLTLEADRIVVGVPDALVGVRGRTGAAYVFERIAGVWERTARLVADDATEGDEFGRSVDSSLDKVVVGSPGAAAGAVSSGAAYVFRTQSGNWSQLAKLGSPTPAPLDSFGWSVAMEGTRIAIGAPFDIHGQIVDAGSVFIFDNLSYAARLIASDEQDGTSFGLSVAVSQARVSGVGINPLSSTASVYVFHRLASGWRNEAQLSGTEFATNSPIATKIAVSGDVLLVGVPAADSGQEANSGIALSFFRDIDCNANGTPDSHDIADGTSPDSNGDGLPDECPDCNHNSMFDGLEVELGLVPDCNHNQLIDLCEVRDDLVPDCNSNQIPDSCDISSGVSHDFNGNAIPDSCECDADITGDGVVGLTDLTTLLSNFGRQSGSTFSQGDMNGDGAINLTDLTFLLSQFGCSI